MYLKLIILTLALIMLSLLGLGIKMLIRKKGDLSDIHIDHNPQLKEKGIVCPHCGETGKCCDNHNKKHE